MARATSGASTDESWHLDRHATGEMRMAMPSRERSGAAAAAHRKRPSNRVRGSVALVARAMMAEIFDGAPEFADLTVVADWTP
jgi:hypothetical protein